MAVLREAIFGMLDSIRHNAEGSIALLGLQLLDVPSRIPELDFVAAQELISADTGEDLTGENDLAPAHERWLGEWALREHGSQFLFVTGYPMSKRPFYTHPDPERPTPRAALTCCSEAWNSSPADNDCIATRTISSLCASATKTRSTTAATSRRSGTGCRRTAASRSGWSAGPPG